MAMSLIRSTQIILRLPSPAILLFNRATRSMLPILSRPPILFHNDEGSHAVLTNKCLHANEDKDNHKNISFLPLESTVAVQHKDAGPQTQLTIVGYGSDDQNGRNYEIRVTKMGSINTRTKRHVRPPQSLQKTIYDKRY